MQAVVDMSETDLSVKECFSDGNFASFMVCTKDSAIRLSMNLGLLKQTKTLIELAIPSNVKAVENKTQDIKTKLDMTLKVVDVRVGAPTYNRNSQKPEIRFYSGKKRKHSIQVRLTWSQLALILNIIEGMSNNVAA